MFNPTVPTNDPVAFERFQARMSKLFSRVQNKDHWKNPIDAEVAIATNGERERLAYAVTFFTGSKPTFTAVRIEGRRCVYRVRAAGYYATIGA